MIAHDSTDLARPKPKAMAHVGAWQGIAKIVLAAGLTLLLLVFLVFARWLDERRLPEAMVRVVEVLPPVALPAPPLPSSSELLTEPQPLAETSLRQAMAEAELPQLERQIEALAPAVSAQLDSDLQLTMQEAVFDLEVDPPARSTTLLAIRSPSSSPAATSSSPVRPPITTPAPAIGSTYDAADLDARPSLTNSPSATYPRSQLRAGVKEGRVLLEVSISTGGSVSVRRVISSSHADFTAMAKQFAARARFTVPKKNGKPVTAIFRWPLILRP